MTRSVVHVEGRAEPIPFDYLVLATGAQYPVESFRPASDRRDDMLADIHSTRSKITKVCSGCVH